MKIVFPSRYLLLGAIFFQVFSITGSLQFTHRPGQYIKGIKGSSLNFTWEFTTAPSNPNTLIYIAFGIWNKGYNFIDKNLIVVERRNARKPWKIKPNTDAVVHGYLGRVQWVGNLEHAQFKASFELSGITDADANVYAIQVDLMDELGTSEHDKVNLMVMPPSLYLSNQKNVFTGRGNQASFTWSYSLNPDDTQSLLSISWGLYKDMEFYPLCVITIRHTAAISQNCTQKANFGKILKPTSMASFVLNNVAIEDEGEYQLRLEGTALPLVGKTTLFVTDPPTITNHPKPQKVVEGRSLNLTCAAYGRPEPTYSWLRNGHVIQANSNGSFLVKSASREDAGLYQCKARNDVGNITSIEAQVVVYYAPTVNVTHKSIKVKLPLRSSESLKCPAVGNPEPTFEWYKDGTHYISNGHHIQVSVINKDDYVTYTCRATNKIGVDNVTFVLVQVGPPSSPTVNCGKREDTSLSRLLKFHWTIPSDDGGAPLLLYTVKRRELKGHLGRGPWRQYNVSVATTWYPFMLEWEKVYELSVTARNKYGESAIQHNTCVVTVGEDPLKYTMPFTQEPSSSLPPVAAKSNGFVDKIPGGKVALYVGIAGVAMVIIIIVVVIRRCQVKRKKDKVKNWTNQQMSGHMEGDFWEGPSAGGGESLFGSGDSRKMSKVGSPSYHLDPKWTVPREKISILKVIGNGAFGLVYKGRVHGLGTNRPGWNIVAIKSPYADATDAETRDLMKEFELLKTLKPHAHVIRLLGCGEDEAGRPLVIIEYVPYGDLLGYLRKSRGEEDDYYSDPEIKPKTSLSSPQLLRFAWQIADGMAYLSSQKIIHRDLAARNVLVGEGEVCKVTDFGMAKDVHHEEIYIRRSEGRLPVKWTAIEALIGGGEYTTQSDVWSFGVVLYEICTIGGEPYPGIAGKDIPDLLETGYRMPCPTHVDATLYEIMASCWNTFPDDRPTFTSLQKLLNTLESVQSKDYINLSECMNQNARGKGPSKTEGNKYHRGPGVSSSVESAVAV